MTRTALPRSEWVVSSCDDDHVCLAMHTNNGFLAWDKVPLSELPKYLAGGRDLEPAFVHLLDQFPINSHDMM